MVDINNIPLVSSEIAGLWSSYEAETMARCVLMYFLKQVNDEETRLLLQDELDKTNRHISILTNIFNQSAIALPYGFTDKDINTNAPRLFTDTFYLAYLSYMSKIGMHNYTLILNHISRQDIVEYFSQRIMDSVELYKKCADLRLLKGVFIKAPRVEIPKEVEYVKNRSFIVDIFGEKRPLILREVTHMFAIIFSNIVGRAMVTGFGQVSKVKEASNFYFEGKDMASNKIMELTSIYTEEGIPIPSTSDSFVTSSTEPPFSEKLMLAHVTGMVSASISNVGMAIADTIRTDLQGIYMKYLTSDKKYANKGANILISNGWMEQPPQAIKHENLVTI